MGVSSGFTGAYCSYGRAGNGKKIRWEVWALTFRTRCRLPPTDHHQVANKRQHRNHTYNSKQVGVLRHQGLEVVKGVHSVRVLLSSKEGLGMAAFHGLFKPPPKILKNPPHKLFFYFALCLPPGLARPAPWRILFCRLHAVLCALPFVCLKLSSLPFLFPPPPLLLSERVSSLGSAPHVICVMWAHSWRVHHATHLGLHPYRLPLLPPPPPPLTVSFLVTLSGLGTLPWLTSSQLEGGYPAPVACA